MTILVGIDVGTSALKAVAVDAERGGALASATREYPLSTPRAGYAEQAPDDFSGAAFGALRELATALGPRASRVRAIGLTGQMHSAVVLDEDLEVVRPAILWCDTRTTAECEVITRALGPEGLARTVGNRALEGFTLPKLLWLREHEPSSFARIRHVLMPKDHVGLRLTGELGTDVSDASGTLCFSPGERSWSREVLDAVGIEAGLFPRAGESTELLGALPANVAAAVGLPVGTPVVRGAADNAAAAVGLGVVRPGRAMVSLGSSGVVLAHTDAFFVDREMRLHSFCHAVPGRYYLMGVMLAAGLSLRWYRDTLCEAEKIAAELSRADPYEVILDTASTAPAGSSGVLFLPYLLGERTPHNDAAARGVLLGLSARTSKADISRAVVEGVSFGLADALALVRAAGPGMDVHEVRATGGGARSRFWRQVLADVLDASVVVTSSAEGPAFGAALLAGVGAGVLSSVEEAADALVHVVGRTEPDPVTAARYRDVHGVWRGVYVDLKARFRELARVLPS